MAGQVDGLALGSLAAGGIMVWAGIKGTSIPRALQAVIQGQKPPAETAYPILGTSSTGGGGGGGGGAAAETSASASETSFFTAVLHNLGAPVTPANLQAFYRWAIKEEPSFPPPNAWNPLNIRSGPSSFAQYASPTAGAFATAGFMLSNDYGAIVASLRTGNGIVDSPEVAAELSAWSGGGYTSVNSGGG